MMIVVGGQARKVGKTTAVCDIIAASKEAEWVAVKLTSHRHAGDSSATSDTERYLAAGARQAMLLHDSADLPAARNLIVESNAIVERIRPDLFVFVRDSSNPEWKPSAIGVYSLADIVVDRTLSVETLRSIAGILLSSPEARE